MPAMIHHIKNRPQQSELHALIFANSVGSFASHKVMNGRDLFPYLKVPLDVRGLEQQNWNNLNPYKHAHLRPKNYLKPIV